MQHIYLLNIILTVFVFASCGKSQNCINRDGIDPNQVCTTIYDPVCGCNDVTYSNECRATANGVVLWSKGPCIR